MYGGLWIDSDVRGCLRTDIEVCVCRSIEANVYGGGDTEIWISFGTRLMDICWFVTLSVRSIVSWQFIPTSVWALLVFRELVSEYFSVHRENE